MSKAGSRILQGAREALAFAKGEADPAEYVIHIPPQVDVRAIRQKTGLSQRRLPPGTDFPSVASAIGNRAGPISMLRPASFSPSSRRNRKQLNGRFPQPDRRCGNADSETG